VIRSLGAQLAGFAGCSTRTARAGYWLARGRLLPLLDGLDEVAEAHRPACADAINAFHTEHPGVSLVVTCRTAEYRELPGALQHGDAIRLLPLEREQIEGYLQGASPALDGLRQAMAQDRWLAEMATSPFWGRDHGSGQRCAVGVQVFRRLTTGAALGPTGQQGLPAASSRRDAAPTGEAAARKPEHLVT
jgi:hypothetical protein